MLDDDQFESQLDAAMACHEAGQLDQAECLYRQILQRDPDQLDTLNLLGLLTQNRGSFDESIALLTRAVELDPEFSEALTNLARAQYALNAVEEAEANAARAVALSPDLAEAHFQYGRALLALNRNDAALSACQRTVALAPGWAEAQADLGLALARAGQFEAAADAYRTALHLQPAYPPALNGLAIVCIQLHQTEAAVDYARKAVEIAPSEPAYWLGLAYALRDNQQVKESLAACQRITELAPDRADAWTLRGENFAMLGDFVQAAQCYQAALSRDPAATDAMAGLARMSKLELEPARIASLRQLAGDESRLPHDRIAAGFALGTALDQLGRYDEAFSSIASANALVRGSEQGRPADLLALGKRIDWLIEVFSRDLFQKAAGCGAASDLPVFVVGMPRSGTTLVEQIAASHPNVVGVGEREDIPNIATRLEDGAALIGPHGWDADDIRREAAQYIDRLREMAAGAVRVTDKLPDNILLLGHIALLWPNARIVVCRRDLRDVALSCFFQNFRYGNSWSSRLEDCAARACEIERLYRHWQEVLPNQILEVEYESLVHEPESESRRLINFLGLEWDSSCISFYESERLVMTSSNWQVRQPVYSTSIGRWRHYLNHIEPLQTGLAGLVESADTADGPGALPPEVATAQQHREAGREAAAEAVLRRVLAKQTNMPDALLLLAKILASRGSLKSAGLMLERAARLNPESGEAAAELARVRRATGDLKGALEAALRACKLLPERSDVHLYVGRLFLDLNKAESAAEAFSRAVSLAPDSLQARLHLGIALLRLGRYHDAGIALEAALKIDPDHVECLTKLGFALSSQDRHDEALRYQARAVMLAPNEPRALYGLALARWQSRDITGAHEMCGQMLEIAPNDPQIWLIRAYSEVALGKFHEAEASYRRALEIYPDFHDAQLGLTELRRDIGDIVESEKLLTALKDVTKHLDERVAAGFALGTIAEKAGRHDDAFAAYAEANRLLRAERNRLATPVRFSQLKRAFSPETLANAAGWGDPTELPVFVVGMPRSGTTLVEQIIGSHPAVFAGGERNDLNSLIMKLCAGDYYLSPTRWNQLEMRKEAAWHIARIQDLAGDAARFVDKMPDNIQLLGHISVIFPNARVIICRRDWRDVCLSCFFRRFTDKGLDWSNDLTDLANRARGIADLMEYWKEVSPLRILEVNYETLVMNTESETRRLIDFLGLEWDPACLAFHETERAVLTASQWQVRQPIYSDSIGRWRLYEKHLGPLLEGLKGYVPED